MRKAISIFCSSVLLIVLLTGCGGDDGGGPGTAPAIKDITYDPKTAPAGKVTTINGGFAFTDAEGDPAAIGITITPPGGAPQSLPDVAVQGAGAAGTSGQLVFLMALNPPSAGSYPFAVRLIDAKGNESNELQGTIEVTAP